MWSKTLQIQSSVTHKSSPLVYEQSFVCVRVCVWKLYPKADWFHHLSLLCPVISLCNSDKCQTMGRGWALTNCSRHPQFTLPPLDTPDELSVTFSYSGQWEHWKRHAAFTCFTKNSFLLRRGEPSEIIYVPGSAEIYLLKQAQMAILLSGWELR